MSLHVEFKLRINDDELYYDGPSVCAILIDLDSWTHPHAGSDVQEWGETGRSFEVHERYSAHYNQSSVPHQRYTSVQVIITILLRFLF